MESRSGSKETEAKELIKAKGKSKKAKVKSKS